MIKNYSGWLNESQDYRHLLTQEQIEWCKRHIKQEWWVNAAGEVEVKNSLTTKKDKEILEFPVQFADVKGNFHCGGAIKLKSLKGAPRHVGRDFACGGCISLESLEGAPQWVGRNFYWWGCTNLKTVRGISAKIGGEIFYTDCPLIPQEEIDLLEEDQDLFLKWAQTEMSVEEFRAKYKGGLKGKKFGI